MSISNARFQNIEPGDRVIFMAEIDYKRRKATRKVVSIERFFHWLQVAYGGHSDFVVHLDCIIEVITRRDWEKLETRKLKRSGRRHENL